MQNNFVFKSFHLLVVFFILLAMLLGEPTSVTARAGEPQLILTKSIDNDITNAKVGDTIFFRIRFACSSLTIDCGNVEIMDSLPTNPNPPNDPLFSYLPAASSVPAGFHLTESPIGTLTITKDDQMLLDGSQYDAVIAVRVNYEVRPLPATVGNQVSGRIKPLGAPAWSAPVTASAPNITIDAPVADWTLTKSLYSPSIEPTVDTDVTYRISLCPNTTEGNVALTNIAMTDTLPSNAAFISASNGGTEAGGVVTWNIAGPITPPTCATRYVTMRFNTADGWAVGDPVTNTAAATGDYLDADGAPCPSCVDSGSVPLGHNIIAIQDTPSYSKSNVGDPVGIDGTARFELHLSTNGTNYPANAVTLIDTLPAELQVKGVTSGTWADDHVRATIQYATNYNDPPNWTNFPSQPVQYNTNALYDSGLPANITKIQWIFEYDSDPNDLNGDGDLAPLPGLPYDWSFAATPQIRVAPRLAATQSDDAAPVPMPIADTIPPTNVYTNCLQVSRIDSGGNFVMGGCQNETMTVEGNFVSLRTTKAATPGYGYDPVADPNIDNFTSDSLILPNDTLKYTLTVEVTERSSIDLVNPVIRDTLPAELVFVRNGTALLDGGAVAQPTFNQMGQQLTWTWNAANPLTVPAEEYGSHFLTVEFYGYVKPGTAPANYTNTMYTVTDSGDVNCEAGSTLADAADVDADGNIAENACENKNTFKVERSAALRGEKWIRSISADNAVVVNKDTYAPDAACPNGGNAGLSGSANNFTRYPCISQAYPEGALSPTDYAPPPTDTKIDDFEYNLRIFNEGNVPMLEYTLYDILPYSGDKGSGGTLVNESRQSQFRPTLTGPVTFISGPAPLTASDFLIEYSASINPCRPEVFDKDPVLYPNTPAGCTDDWMDEATVATLPGKWNDIRAYRIELISGSIAAAVAPGQELRFGVPMHIPADMPTLGVVDNDDAQSKEIAWNSYSHVGSYDKDEGAPVVIQDLLASEPRKVGITIPERFSIGNRVWRDSDNSGDINAPDDTNPGIENVLVKLYEDADGNGIPDGAAIASTLTDSGGYYLFSNLPEGRYVVGIPASNFDVVGDPLYGLHSSTGEGALPVADYTNPPDLTPDTEDHGIDTTSPPVASTEVFSASIQLSPNGELSNEADLSSNDRDGIAGARRGVNGERNENSDLTVDFGFFGGSDVPFSIGNFVWKDDGANGGVINNGIFEDGKEIGAPNVLVNLYRDGNGNGIPEAAELIRTDLTDTNGFYLFDNLDPGKYYVQIDKTNFAAGGKLEGWYSSEGWGTELVYVTGNNLVHSPATDSDDNGIDKAKPEVDGITSGMIELSRIVGEEEVTGETHLSANPADGPLFIGNYGETDATSNITIDFGFVPPMSLGNRIWIDDGSGELTFRAGYNNGIMDGTELGKAGVTVELWLDDGDGVFNSATDTPMYTDLTDTSGYYLFERLRSGEDYFVRIPNTNFDASSDPLYRYISSYDGMQTSAPADDVEDKDDNGIDNNNPAANGVVSSPIHMEYDTESTTETDLGSGLGTLGQEDNDSNLTVDFGFVQPPRSVGNYLWFDTDNDRTRDVTELPVANALVRLYLDAGGNGIPDDVNGDLVLDANDSIAYDETDAGGFYLFDNLPPNRYLVTVDSDNFNAAGTYNALVEYASSTGRLTGNNQDNGFDRVLPGDAAASPYGILSGVVDLRVTTASPTTDETIISADTGSAAGFNPTEDDGANSRGRYGEANNASDLRIDFGFFKPMSIGNRVFYDNGAGANLNNGIMDGDEAPIPNVQVELWRETNSTPGLQTTGATPDLRALYDGVNPYTDLTDANGYYLFDNLPAGNYYVYLPASNFTGSGKLVGWYSSTPPSGDDDVDVNDNGINDAHPDVNGIASEMINLALNSESLTESQLSGATTNPGSPTNDDFSPSPWDGPESRGRWNESDVNSNLTIDFGFYPVFSLGNRVWYDTNNSRTIDGAEVGVDGVRVHLFASDGTTEIEAGADGVLGTSDDGTGGMLTSNGGYYLFNNLPAGDYVVKLLNADNFAAGKILEGYWSSGISRLDNGNLTEIAAPDPDDDADVDDNGMRQSNGDVISQIITLGAATTAEPASEADLNGGSQGQPDTQANMTIDFGFYNITLGDLVWGDANNDGLTPGESGLTDVDVQLWVKDGVSPFATTTTVGGVYSFEGLPAGNYFVRIPADEFNPGGILRDFISSTGSAVAPFPYEPGVNVDGVPIDSDDNGTAVGSTPGPDGTYNSSLGLGAYVQSSVFALTPGAEQTSNDALGLTIENRVDLGLYSSAQTNLTITKDDGVNIYIPNGALTYTITVTNHGPADVVNARVDDAIPPQIASWTWTCAAGTPAAYNCSGASSNSSNFQDFIDLPQGASLTYTVSVTIVDAPTNSLNNTVTVAPPAGVIEIDNTDNSATDSDDLASVIIDKDDSLSIVSPNGNISYQLVVTNNGMVDLSSIVVSDTLPADLTFLNATPAPTTQSGNTLAWSGISLTSGGSTTITVNARVNGSPSASFTNTARVEDTTTGASDEDDDTDNAAVTEVKTLIAASEHPALGSPVQVFIGETLTYRIQITLPPGMAKNLVATDVLDAGLAFDECTPAGVVVSDPLVTTTLADWQDACPAVSGDPRVTNNGHDVQFTFGDVTNNSGTDQTIIVEYQVVVLDIASNRNGVGGLNNGITWKWDGGSLAGSADSVEIVEPDMSIKKTANPQVAALNSTINFTLEIEHTAQSASNAYDVIVTDILPDGFGYVDGSAVYSGTAPAPAITTSGATMLTITWDEFPLGDNATITFQAVFLGPSPVTNEANVAWTSLPLDPGAGGAPVQQSEYNESSTERWYDPADPTGIDNYRVSDSVTVAIPQHLPETGFAPNIQTTLPEMPANFSYHASNLHVEIPRLGVNLNIVGVPFKDGDWNLTWLGGSEAGWIEGTAFPTHAGNSALTAHAYLASGLPGPFAKLGSLQYGDQIIIHLDGKKYIYEMRESTRVRPDSAQYVLRHEDLAWLTLITCHSYDESTKSYRYRIVVRAVLVKVE